MHCHVDAFPIHGPEVRRGAIVVGQSVREDFTVARFKREIARSARRSAEGWLAIDLSAKAISPQ